MCFIIVLHIYIYRSFLFAKMSYISDYKYISRPYDPLRNDVMLNPDKYGMSYFSNEQYNAMLGASAERIYYSNTNYSSSSSSDSSKRSGSGRIPVRTGEFWSYGLCH